MRRKLPSTQALACFESAARHQSYTRAAQELSLTQGAVSRQITALEGFVGVTLFRRTQHGVALTSAGADYARQVSHRLAALERDTLEVMTHRGAGGALQLAAVATFATRWLIPRLPDLAREHPDLTVHIDVRTRPFLFTDSGFDAALYAGTPEQVARWPGTGAQRLVDETVVPVCSPALMQGRAQLSPDEIAHLPLLQQSTRPDAWPLWFEAQGVQARQPTAGPRYELFSMQAAAAECGLGVALMPLLLIGAELASGRLVQATACAGTGERAYYLITPNDDHNPPAPALDRFRGWLMRQTTAHAVPDPAK
jgi:DNA-binding transcriptional LysR family regulator